MTLSAVVLLLANLVPLAGVVFLDWDLQVILLAFWSETAVVGLFGILKMVLARGQDRRRTPSKASRLVQVPFFLIHLTLFMAIHGVFVGMMVLDGEFESVSGLDLLLVAPRTALGMPEIRYVLAASLLSHGVSFFMNFLGRGERDQHGPTFFMTQPYRRIAILHIAVLLGAFAIDFFDQPVVLLAALVVVKTAFDLRAHLAERTDGAERAGNETVA